VSRAYQRIVIMFGFTWGLHRFRLATPAARSQQWFKQIGPSLCNNTILWLRSPAKGSFPLPVLCSNPRVSAFVWGPCSHQTNLFYCLRIDHVYSSGRFPTNCDASKAGTQTFLDPMNWRVFLTLYTDKLTICLRNQQSSCRCWRHVTIVAAIHCTVALAT